jgi:hypothetical protein
MPRRPKTPAAPKKPRAPRKPQPPPVARNNKEIGRKAQAQGAALQDLLRPQLQRYNDAGHLAFETAPPFRIVGTTARGLVVVPVGVGAPDLDVWCKDGRRVIAEMKNWPSTQKPRWLLSQVKPHQGAAFVKATKMGATCGVVLMFHGAIFWLPWPAIADRWIAREAGKGKTGECSLTALDIATIGRRVVGFDWLSAALETA